MARFGTFICCLVLFASCVAVVCASCPNNHAQDPNGTCIACGTWEYPIDGVCSPYASRIEKLNADKSGSIDSGDTAWMLTASALVFIMTPGLAFFYAGLIGANSVINTMLMSLVSIAVISLYWILLGYSFGFGPDGNSGWGGTGAVAMQHIATLPSSVYTKTIPHAVFVSFQCMFAQITPALISGAIVGRMTFPSYCLYIVLWSAFVYSTLAHWMWSDFLADDGTVRPLGWLRVMGAVDFAGGVVIHTSSGFAGLGAAMVIGPRKNKEQKPSNIPLVMQGAALLYFGWFGFNAGGAGASNGVAGIAFLNTHISASAAVVTWMLIETLHKGTQTAVGAAVAIVVGLVCVTPACGFITTMAAVAFGSIGAACSYIFIEVKTRYLKVDDALDAFACHGIGGIVGSILLGCFATKTIGGVDGAFYGRSELLLYQFIAVVCGASFSFVGTIVVLLAMKYTIGIRVSEEVEESCMDLDLGRKCTHAPKDSTMPITLLIASIHNGMSLWASIPEVMPDAIDVYYRYFRKAIDLHECYEVGTACDVFTVACKTPGAAVRLAADLQQSFFEHHWNDEGRIDEAYRHFEAEAASDNDASSHGIAEVSPEKYRRSWNGLRLRVGIHTGLCGIKLDKYILGYTYFGETYDITALTENSALGGQVLITKATLDALHASEDSSRYSCSPVNPKASSADCGDVPYLYQILAVDGRKFQAENVPTISSPVPPLRNKWLTFLDDERDPFCDKIWQSICAHHLSVMLSPCEWTMRVIMLAAIGDSWKVVLKGEGQRSSREKSYVDALSRLTAVAMRQKFGPVADSDKMISINSFHAVGDGEAIRSIPARSGSSTSPSNRSLDNDSQPWEQFCMQHLTLVLARCDNAARMDILSKISSSWNASAYAQVPTATDALLIAALSRVMSLEMLRKFGRLD
jgi:Amt family ammonium transporter